MANLNTTYLGLELDNPIIAASSGLSGSIDGIRRLTDAGAGAIVLKSMFEELIIADSDDLERELIQSEHPEAYEYMRAELAMQIGPRPYLKFIEDAKKAAFAPVIASVNCTSGKWWVSYAKNIESAGADALELNISHFPATDRSSAEIEAGYADIVREVTDSVDIPVAVKLGFYFTSLGTALKNIVGAGAKGLVLFNRLYSVDVDIDKRKVVPAMRLSAPEEMLIPLRWVGVLSEDLDCDIAASTGIHDADSIVKMLMVGAQTVQVCSTLYRNKPEHIQTLKDGLSERLDAAGFDTIDDLRGCALSHTEEENVLFHRLQYVKALEEAAGYKY